MIRSVRGPDYNRPMTKESPKMCEAEDRNKRALYLLENEWGCGRINLGDMRRILRGDEPDTCDKEGATDVQPNILPATA